MADLHLACSACRQSVTVGYSEADLQQGRTELDSYRPCPRCGQEMAETGRGNCGHVLIPGEKCSCRS
jgi:hypothetical protein